MKDATGFRLAGFFFADEAALVARFKQHGYPVPEFRSLPGSANRVALTTDPDGQAVELTIVPNVPAATYQQFEIGLTVSNIEKSRAFYRDFMGLEELAPIEDPLFGTTKYSFRNGSTIVSLRSFGANLPADKTSGFIQIAGDRRGSRAGACQGARRHHRSATDRPRDARVTHRVARRSGRHHAIRYRDGREPSRCPNKAAARRRLALGGGVLLLFARAGQNAGHGDVAFVAGVFEDRERSRFRGASGAPRSSPSRRSPGRAS